MLADKIPRDILVNTYHKHINNGCIGADGINHRVVISAIIKKYIYNLDDHETVQRVK
jgi:hypothetical protein